MNKRRNMSLFDFETPLFTGHMQDWLLKTGDVSRSFPPYNIDLIGDKAVKVTLAVAGYSMEDIEILLDRDTKGERILSISGKTPKQKSVTDEVVSVTKGIAMRSFSKSFNLHKYLEVQSATLDNGMLEILLIKNLPERKKPVPIHITSPPSLE